MLKKFVAVLAMGAMAFAAVGCGDDDSSTASTSATTESSAAPAAESKPKVALVLKTLSNPVWQATKKGAEEKAKELGLDFSVAAGKTEEDIQGQINIIEDLMVKDVKAIVITANGTGQLKPVLERAQAQGIKIVLIDTDVPGLDRVTLLQTDNRGMSKQISDTFVEELGGKGTAGVLTFPNVSPVELRVQGSKDAVEGTDVKIVSELAGDCARNKAVSATDDMLQAHPDITAIFGECGQNGAGAVQAIKAAGKTPGKDIKVIGFDGVPQEIQLIEKGEMFATVWQDFPTIGATAIQNAVDAVGGKTFPAVTNIPGQVVTKDNVGEFKIDGQIVLHEG